MNTGYLQYLQALQGSLRQLYYMCGSQMKKLSLKYSIWPHVATKQVVEALLGMNITNLQLGLQKPLPKSSLKATSEFSAKSDSS